MNQQTWGMLTFQAWKCLQNIPKQARNSKERVKINGLIGRKIYRNPWDPWKEPRVSRIPCRFPKTPRLKALKMAEILSLQGANAWNPQTFARERRRIVGKPRVRPQQCHFWQESRGVCPSKCEFPASFFRKPIWGCSGMQFAWRGFEFFFFLNQHYRIFVLPWRLFTPLGFSMVFYF